MKKPVDKICFFCEHYKIHTPGGAYCEKHKAYFPNPKGWHKPKYHPEYANKPGDRTCKQWKRK